MMRIVSAAELATLFTFPDLVEALRDAFRRGAEVPVRHHHTIALTDAPAATLLLMPAWDHEPGEEAGHIGVKVVTVHPGNASRGRPSVSGTYLLMAARTGEILALIDGQALTLWRTAAASALAASYLARPDASRMVMVGAGALAPSLIEAHASVSPLRDILVWNRNPAKAEAVAAALSGKSYQVSATTHLDEAVRSADVISCATLSSEPLIRGAWLKPGAHLDLVGAYTPAMRESDDEAVRRARLFVDTREGALKEAGDIVQPLRAGLIRESDVAADLCILCRGEAEGRQSAEEITLFKSVGTALEDLAAASHAFRRAQSRGASS